MIFHHYHHIDPESMGLLRAINCKLSLALSNQETIMASLDQLKTEVTNLTAKVAAQTSLDTSTSTLIAGLNQTNKDLAAQIAKLNADTVTQADIDALAKQVSDNASAIDAGTQQLTQAVPQNTSAAQPAPSAPSA